MLFEASTLTAEWADIQISGLFALDGNIHNRLREDSISYIGLDDYASYIIYHAYMYEAPSHKQFLSLSTPLALREDSL